MYKRSHKNESMMEGAILKFEIKFVNYFMKNTIQ